ncbi:hypothetical protein EMIHUDRAFT_468279 [Emiliania huxleyi CCMP1516]|uniref:Glycosyltransferase family 1 protein n=2 Tax=Emiliania huxleyi TaxID=2903 RepID=A0A0D3K570_EMIH1|nr:hypothetical protein EMIHUDRAFT_468279 [Emiliania huxleyi CCMP1516]EOD30905.1 hypothetical protein EMIHUDRAFT_468279 [Emiliania huxleyi CCMP1516]|eukprot:XP_005783334.1 hypothetical protein EMIHUDRAFT_468279 [Emiliania huxleyi CCMP1516]
MAMEAGMLHPKGPNLVPTANAVVGACWEGTKWTCARSSLMANPIDNIHVDWPYRLVGAPVDVWLWWAPHHRNWEEWRYLPVLMTIASALSRRNYSVAYTDASRTRDDIVAEVVRHGSPVVVLFGYWNAVPGTREIVSRVVAKGAHLVLYNSEPLGVLYNRQPLAHNKHILATKELYNASELWDYSLANLEWLRPHVQLTLRHVPPSYVPDFDLGVQATRRGVGVVGTRPPPKTYAQNTALLWHNVTQAELQTWADMRQFLTTHPLQLVFHRVPQGNLCPFEAFRGAVLASNRACIVAQDSHPLDQHYWAGIVHFAPTPADLPRIVNRFMSDPALLADCQALTYNAFVTNHTATAALEQAGVLNLLTRRIQKYRPPK